MAALIPFTSNYTDVSTYEGYQFEFHCQRCGNGYRSAFRHSVTGFGGRLAALGGGILGGEIGARVQEVGLLAQWDRSSTRGSTNDKRLLEASEDVAGHFVQCRGGCAEWVCRDVCWDGRAGCCTAVSAVPRPSRPRARASGRSPGSARRARVRPAAARLRPARARPAVDGWHPTGGRRRDTGRSRGSARSRRVATGAVGVRPAAGVAAAPRPSDRPGGVLHQLRRDDRGPLLRPVRHVPWPRPPARAAARRRRARPSARSAAPPARGKCPSRHGESSFSTSASVVLASASRSFDRGVSAARGR